MSFKFQWPTFSPAFHADAARMLDGALNRGPKPKVIADDIRVHELGMGSIPPELEILEIGDLSTDRFRGIFRLTYAGDAHLVLSTKVQANPLAPAAAAAAATSASGAAGEAGFGLFPTPGRGILFAAAPLIVPMQLRLSAVRLRAIVVLVVSRQKGITLVFKNDPLESVDVSSTFDSVAVIQKYLQSEIEGQLREMFREDLPGIIHRLSQRWLAGDAKHVNQEADPNRAPTAVPVGAKGAAAAAPLPVSPSANKRETPLPKSISDPHALAETASAPGAAALHSAGKRALSRTTSAAASSPPKSRSGAAARKRPTHTAKAASTSAVPLHGELSAHGSVASHTFGYTGSSSAYGYDTDYGWGGELETYDPTYGLRPDELRPPASAGYSGLARLATQAKGGLRDLATWSGSNAGSVSASSPPTITATAVGEASFSWTGSDPRYAASPDRNDGATATPQDEGETDEEQDEEEDLISPRSAHRQLDFDDVEDLEGIPDARVRGPDSESDIDASPQDDNDDNDDVDDVEDLEEAADYSRYGYPPPSAAFSDTAVEASARRSASLFGGRASPSSPAGTARSRAVSSIGGRTTRAGASKSNLKLAPPQVEYETIPAVGGGTITRPRVYHIASRVQAPEVDEFDNGFDENDVDEDERTARRQGSFTGTTHASSTVRGPGSTRTFTAGGGASPMASPFSEAPPASLRSSARRPAPPRMQSWTQGEYVNGEEEADEEEQQTHSRSGSLSHSNSGDGSLDTLEPEPMDPRSSAYRTHLYRHKTGPAYRAGYGSSETASVVSGSLSSSSHSGAGYARYGGGASGGAAQRTSSHLSTAPTSQYPSTHDVASTAGKPFSSRSGSASAPLSSSPRRSGDRPPAMTLDASAHLADLVNSNHTLSPYTRTADTTGFAVRSAPITPGGSGASTPAHLLLQRDQLPREALAAAAQAAQAERDALKTTPRPAPRRRRTFKLGSGTKTSGSSTPSTQPDDVPSSACSASATAAGARSRPALSPVQARSRVSSRTSSAPSVDTRSSSASSGLAGRSGSYAPRGMYGSAASGKHPLHQVHSLSRAQAETEAEAEWGVDPADQARNGFAAWAGTGPKSFPGPAESFAASNSSSGASIASERRRSTGRAFMPPSEAALPGASRWAAIRE